ncbi:MAG: DUF3180 family protein [Pseudonocardiaceae bacterium]|nr:DUF3180 family protein [Pseudonocardiaceae bacterium]
MHFTRPRELVGAGLVGLVVVFVLLQLAYQSIPRFPTFAGVTLLVLALIEVPLAFSMRSRVREGRFVQPVTAARTVALAKASSLLGAIMLGGWFGVLGYVLPKSGQLLAAEQDTSGALVGVFCAAALIAAALWLEYCCRTPDDQRDDRRDRLGADD